MTKKLRGGFVAHCGMICSVTSFWNAPVRSDFLLLFFFVSETDEATASILMFASPGRSAPNRLYRHRGHQMTGSPTDHFILHIKLFGRHDTAQSGITGV
jgi:cytochrome c biogenesis factor